MAVFFLMCAQSQYIFQRYGAFAIYIAIRNDIRANYARDEGSEVTGNTSSP